MGVIDVGYNLIYLGGDGVDQVKLNSGVTVDNISFIDLGKGLTVADKEQQLFLDNSSYGNFTAKAGNATVRNQFASSEYAKFNNGLTIDFCNQSINQIAAYGQVTGNALIRGGEDNDRISFGISGGETNLNVLTFNGQDTAILNNSADLASLFINFGEEIDEFINQFNGSEPFPVTLVNLP